MATFTQALKFENGTSSTLFIEEQANGTFNVRVNDGPIANAHPKRSTAVDLGEHGTGNIAVQTHGERVHYQFGSCAIQLESRKGFLSTEAAAA